MERAAVFPSVTVMTNDDVAPALPPHSSELPEGRRRLRQWRVPVLIVALAAVLVATRGADSLVSGVPILALLVGVGAAVAAVAFYAWLCRKVEARETVEEVAAEGRWSGLRRGFLLGGAMFTATLLIIAMFGGWDIDGGSFWAFLAGFGAMASVAVNEELLFRGVVFRILEERTGTVISFVLSCLIFGFAHGVNANATVWGLLSIAIEGGSLVTAAYVLTRSLWLPIGIHLAWDFTEGGIFGVQNSGTEQAGLLHTKLLGADWLTGGTFGPEASPFAMLICLAVSAFLLRRAARKGQFRPRPWAVAGRENS
jgi:membrane protease YdiL (CAAX protease family)